MKILSRYMIREIASSTAIGFLLYTFLMLMNIIFFLAEQAYKYDISFSVIAQLIVLYSPAIIVLTLPMALLLGIMVGMSRLSAEGEITAMRSCGISLFRVLRPILAVCLLFTGLNTWLMLKALPWGNAGFARVMGEEVVTKNIRRKIIPKTFATDVFPGQDLVVYVNERDLSDPSSWKNVFLYREVEEGPDRVRQVILADRMRLEFTGTEAACWLDLTRATVHSVDVRRPDWYSLRTVNQLRLIVQYEERKSTRQKKKEVVKNLRAQTLGELGDVVDRTRGGATPADQMRHRMALAEIHKRFSIPATCLVFGLVGVVAGVATKKGGKAYSFIVSLAVFFLYYISLIQGESLAGAGRISPFLGMWGANILIGILGVAAFLLKARERSLARIVGPLMQRIVRRGHGRPPAERRPGAGPVLIIRAPRIHPSFPNILDRYISREFLRWFARLLPSLLIAYGTVDFFQNAEDFIRNKTEAATLVKVYKYLTPQMLSYCVPVAAMVATLVTFSILTRTNETTAMRASGISIYRISVPVILASLILSGFGFYLYNYILPGARENHERYLKKARGQAVEEFVHPMSPWIAGADGHTFYNYEFFMPGRNAFQEVAIFNLSPDMKRLETISSARYAFWKGSQWHLARGWTRTLRRDGNDEFNRFDEKNIVFSEDLSTFNRKWKKVEYMTRDELREYRDFQEQKGVSTTPVRMAIFDKFSWPVQTLVMVLISIPFSFLIGRKGALTGVGVSIAIGIVYFAGLNFFSYLGKVGMMSPFFASWTPNLLFGAGAVYMLARSRT